MYVTVVVLMFFLYSSTRAVDYCELTCTFSEQVESNTVCNRKDVDCGAGPKCGSSYRPITLDDGQKKYVLDLHNNLRNKVATGSQENQPSASNMNALSYNKELEYIAQCLTNTCEFKHDKCRRSQDYTWVGQNLALQPFVKDGGSVEEALNKSVSMWYNEVGVFDPSLVDSYVFEGKYGHYSQVVWAETKEIGCGITFHIGDDGWDTYLVGCNYGPSGNFHGQPVYKQGNPASNCGNEQQNPTYNGLCGNDEV